MMNGGLAVYYFVEGVMIGLGFGVVWFGAQVAIALRDRWAEQRERLSVDVEL
jgi:hypothetical protein